MFTQMFTFRYVHIQIGSHVEMFNGEPPEMLTSGQGPPHWQEGEGTQAVASAARGAPTSSTYTPCVCTAVRAHSTIRPPGF